MLPLEFGAMHIKEDLRFGKTRRDSVPRLRLIHGSSAIGDQFSFSVVNRNDQSRMHQAGPGVETDAKLNSRLLANSALDQIGMSAIDGSQLEVQG